MPKRVSSRDIYSENSFFFSNFKAFVVEKREIENGDSGARFAQFRIGRRRRVRVCSHVPQIPPSLRRNRNQTYSATQGIQNLS